MDLLATFFGHDGWNGLMRLAMRAFGGFDGLRPRNWETSVSWCKLRKWVRLSCSCVGGPFGHFFGHCCWNGLTRLAMRVFCQFDGLRPWHWNCTHLSNFESWLWWCVSAAPAVMDLLATFFGHDGWNGLTRLAMRAFGGFDGLRPWCWETSVSWCVHPSEQL